jgi:hypothetical protein
MATSRVADVRVFKVSLQNDALDLKDSVFQNESWLIFGKRDQPNTHIGDYFSMMGIYAACIFHETFPHATRQRYSIVMKKAVGVIQPCVCDPDNLPQSSKCQESAPRSLKKK